jgi:hypothetical protein
VCKRHKDVANIGTSFIISLGDYTGGELVIIDEDNNEFIVDAYCKLIAFDGSKYTHYNKPHIGTKYSLIYNTNKFIYNHLKNI